MALTITTDLTVITNGNDGTWTDISGGGGSAAEPDYFVQGTGCRSRAVSGASASRGMVVDIGAGNELDFSSGGTEEDMLIYFWIQDYTPGLTDNVATAPGLTIRISEAATPTSDFAEWDIIYSDLLAPPGTEFFRVYVLDPRCPPTRTNGTWDYNNCRHFGAVLDTNNNAKGQNLGIDRISYGFGELTVTGTATDAASGFQEMIDENWNTVNDSVAIGSNGTARNGILEVKGKTAFVKGKLVIGDDSGTLSTTFTGQDTVFEWLPTYYYDGTRILPTVGWNDSQEWTGYKSDGTAYYGLDVRGNGTGDTDVTFGAIVGTDQGRSGPTFVGSDQIPTVFTFDDGAVEDVLIYGTTFDNIRYIDFSSNANTDDLYGCTFKRCGTIDLGPVVARNNNFISGIGGAYTFLERFQNIEAGAAEQLSTADPQILWQDILNGTDWSIPDGSEYVELLGGTTRTNITAIGQDFVASDDHYAEFIVNFPSGGATQGTLGPVIALDTGGSTQDYFWMEVDLVNDQVELFRVDTGTDTSIAGPTTFTMDEDEDYIVLLRRNGTTVEGFISGNSAADGLHTTKLSATDSNHTGTTHRWVGLRGDALSGQTGDAPRVRLFGSGPITDDLGQVLFDTAANTDFDDANFINCARALSWDTTGSYGVENINLSGNLVDAHNDSNGLVTCGFTGGSGVPGNVENTGSGTDDFTATVTLTVHVEDTDETNIEGAAVYMQKSTPTEFTSGAGNTAGDADLVVTQTIDSDIPTSGTCIVYDVSENLTLPYRYVSITAPSTFVFAAELTGSATSTDGTNPETRLISTSTNFLTADIEEGDTIRNTTDNSYAVVDRIIDADNLTTSPLQGGTNNEWQNTNAFSVHRLATTLVSGTDTVDVPLINSCSDGFTNASGDVTKSFNFASNTDVFVRVRANSTEDTTRYVPGRASGEITSSGVLINVALREDPVAT